MDSGYYAAMTGLVARTQALDIAATNLSNAQTPGYRAEQEYFRSVLMGPDASDSQLGQTVNNYGLLGGDRLNLAQGAIEQTGNPLDLAIEGQEPIKTIIADVQYDPVKGKIIHADLHQINMKEKINAHVKLKFIGESKAVKEESGVLVHNISELEIRCLPNDLIHEIDVDISALNSFDDAITIADLKIPANVEILHHEPGAVVANVARPRVEVEETVVAPVAEAAAATPETEKKEE